MKNKQQQRGSALMMVVIIFAVTLLLGTGLMAAVTKSYSQAISEANNQQAYYAAKTVLDTFKDKINEESSQKQKEILEEIVRNEGDSGKTSKSIELTDTKGGKWASHLTIALNIEKSIDGIRYYNLIAKSESINNRDIQGIAKGVIMTDESRMGTGDSAIYSWHDLKIHLNEDMNLSNAYSVNNIYLDSNKNIYGDTIHAGYGIKIGMTHEPKEVLIDNLYATQGITVEAIKLIKIEEIATPYPIKLISKNGSVEVGKISALELNITADNAQDFKDDETKFFTHTGKYTINGVTKGCQTLSGLGAIEPFGLPDAKMVFGELTQGLALNTIDIGAKHVTISKDNKDRLVVKEEDEIISYIDKGKPYEIKSVASGEIHFKDIDFKDDEVIPVFNIFINPNDPPTIIKFEKNRHVTFGGFYTNNGAGVWADNQSFKENVVFGGQEEKYAKFTQYE